MTTNQAHHLLPVLCVPVFQKTTMSKRLSSSSSSYCLVTKDDNELGLSLSSCFLCSCALGKLILL
jgi:hypothetical protein